MRIIIHDRPGYAFSAELSRELARRRHEVLHLHDLYFQSPKGALQKTAADSDSFAIKALKISQPLQKYSFIKRRFQEVEYGKLLAEEIKSFRPQVLVSANTPPDAQEVAFKACRKAGVPFVSWVHDIHGLAIGGILAKKYSFLGTLIGQYYLKREARIIQQSDKVVLITEDFLPLMRQWSVPESRIHIVPNWAPIEKIPSRPKQNLWAQSHQVANTFNFLYAGTLGLKHNPELLLQLARRFQDQSQVQVIVVSEGLGADWLKEKQAEYGLFNLQIINFQPLETFPDVLASGDVLIAVLTPDAGEFSVPSKVLSYLCAERPLLLAVPPDNLASRIVTENQTGLVAQPEDLNAFVEAAGRLYTHRQQRQLYARNGRAYAEKHFNLEQIGDIFEGILQAVSKE